MAKIKVGRGELTISFDEAKDILPDTRVEIRLLSEISAPRVWTVNKVLPPQDGWPQDFILVDEDGFWHHILPSTKIKVF